jgi:hypothetical protein
VLEAPAAKERQVRTPRQKPKMNWDKPRLWHDDYAKVGTRLWRHHVCAHGLASRARRRGVPAIASVGKPPRLCVRLDPGWRWARLRETGLRRPRRPRPVTTCSCRRGHGRERHEQEQARHPHESTTRALAASQAFAMHFP